jgi:hypothetical protein
MLTAETEDLKVCRMNVSRQEGHLSILDFHYLVATKNDVKHYEEIHEIGLFTREEMLKAFNAASLKADFGEKQYSDRGLYIARTI